MLLERLVRRVFDRNGLCWQRVTRCRPLAPAEYDAHCAAAAETDFAAGRLPSLRWSLGDRRTGAQLLGEMADDRRLTLARLRGSRRGRVWLGQLASEVRRRFARRVEEAAAALEKNTELAALALRLQERPWPPGDGWENVQLHHDASVGCGIGFAEP